MMPQQLAALIVSIAAGVFDLRSRRIPNWLTFGAAVSGLAFHSWGGPWAGLDSLAALVVGLALFFPFFALGGLGAGDVKLLAALGAWLGLPAILWAAFYTALAGGVLALIVAGWHGLLGTSLRNLWLILTHWRVTGPRPVEGFTLRTATSPRLPYSIPIGTGVVLAIWLG